MVHVELTMTSLDPCDCRIVEPFAPSVKLRLQTIETLANAGIFVRVMAMPLIVRPNESVDEVRIKLDQLKNTTLIVALRHSKTRS